MDDIHAYIPAFKYIASDNSNFYIASSYYYKMQYGYFVLNKIIGFFSTSEYYFQFVIGCIISIPYFYIIKKYSPIVWLSCLLYFMGFVQSTYVLRQHTAISIAIIAFPLIVVYLKTNKIKYLLYVLLIFGVSVSIHPTAAILLLITGLLLVKKNYNFVLYVLLFTILLYYLLPILSAIFVDNTEGYQKYIDEARVNSFGTIIFYIPLWVFATIYVVPYKNNKVEWFFLYRLLCLTTSFAVVSVLQRGGQTIPRLIMFFTCYDCIFIPYVAKRIDNKLIRYGFIAMYLVFAFYMFAISEHSAIGKCELIF